jgi:hypothetical protein
MNSKGKGKVTDKKEKISIDNEPKGEKSSTRDLARRGRRRRRRSASRR